MTLTLFSLGGNMPDFDGECTLAQRALNGRRSLTLTIDDNNINEITTINPNVRVQQRIKTQLVGESKEKSANDIYTYI